MKTRYIIAIAAAMASGIACQKNDIGTVYAGSDGIVTFAPSVGGIVSGVKSSASEAAPAATCAQSLTLIGEDGGYSLPISCSISTFEGGALTKATLINENGEITDDQFATAIGNTFWVAAWNVAATPAQIIPDATAKAFTGGYVSTNKEYQKVMYRDGVSGTHYWMTVQPQTATVEGAPEHADDEYIWKSTEAKKTFYAYANVPEDATVALIEKAGGQTMTCTDIPTQDILMGYYSDDGGGTGTASINFHHPLAAVKVKTGTLASGVTISSVAIENVYGSGDLMVKQVADEFTWTGKDGAEFTDDNLVTLGITCDGDAVFVIPQTFPSKARIRVTLKQGVETFNVYTPLTLPWSNGTVYTYTIGYNPTDPDTDIEYVEIAGLMWAKDNLAVTDWGKEEWKGTGTCRGDFFRPGDIAPIYSDYDETSGFQYIDESVAKFGSTPHANPQFDANGTLAPECDAARQILGGSWRMPTLAEFDRLIRSTYIVSIGVINQPQAFYVFLPDATHAAGTIGTDFGTLDPADAVLVFPQWIGQADGKNLLYTTNGPTHYYTSTRCSLIDYLHTCMNMIDNDKGWKSFIHGAPIRPVRDIKPSERKSVKIGGKYWATMNVGATTVAGSPSTCYGDYYAWGETEPYYSKMTITNANLATFTWKSGKTSGYFWNSYCGSGGFTEWDPVPFDDNKVLKPGCDVATQKWGPTWRMPTRDDFVALRNACTGGSGSESSTPTALNSSNPSGGVYWLPANQSYLSDYYGVAGLLFVDKNDTSKRVFFPAAGSLYETGILNGGAQGYYWSDLLYTTSSPYAYAFELHFNSIVSPMNVDPSNPAARCDGFPIRPVHD